jgi:hypothetical protein
MSIAIINRSNYPDLLFLDEPTLTLSGTSDRNIAKPRLQVNMMCAGFDIGSSKIDLHIPDSVKELKIPIHCSTGAAVIKVTDMHECTCF